MVGSILAGGASITDRPNGGALDSALRLQDVVIDKKRSEDVESVCLLCNCEVVSA